MLGTRKNYLHYSKKKIKSLTISCNFASSILFSALAISSIICSECPRCKGKDVNIWYSHWVHGVLNELHPGVALLSGTGVNLHHLWVCGAGGDEEEAALLVGHLSHDQLLQGDNGGSLVLLMRRVRHRMRRAEWSRKNMQREKERDGKQRRRENLSGLNWTSTL